MFSKCLQDIFKSCLKETFIKKTYCKYVLKTSWKTNNFFPETVFKTLNPSLLRNICWEYVWLVWSLLRFITNKIISIKLTNPRNTICLETMVYHLFVRTLGNKHIKINIIEHLTGKEIRPLIISSWKSTNKRAISKLTEVTRDREKTSALNSTSTAEWI